MQRWILPLMILAALLLAAFGSMAVPQGTAAAAASTVLSAATATPTPAGAEASQSDASGEDNGLADLAQLNPPPQLSARSLGITTVPCDSTLVLDDPNEVEGKTYACGVFTVPQNWDAPDDRNLDLTFMVIKASGPDPEPDPLVFSAGGPGQSSILTSIAAYDKIRPTRDIVRLDQRGTGLSQRLDVPECLVLALRSGAGEDKLGAVVEMMSAPPADDSAAPDAEENAADQSVAIQAKVNALCWEQFTNVGIDPNQFTTANAARDMVELVKALGYKSYNLHGTSYGTRLAMTILRGVPGVEDAPELRAVVLDSANPPSVNVLTELPRANHDPVLQLLEDCEQDDVCRGAYPNLKQRLHLIFAKLEAEPLVIDGQTVTAKDLAAQLSNLNGTRPGYMPLMIAELEQGSLTTYNALADRNVGFDSPEGVGGLDRSDPVQAFITDAMIIVVQGTGSSDGALSFIVNIAAKLTEDDPRAALTDAITANYEGETQAKLLERLGQLSAQDFADSPYIAKTRQQAAAAAELAADPAAAAARQQVQQRRLALVSLATLLNHNIHCNEDFQHARYGDVLNTYHDLEFPELGSLSAAKGLIQDCTDWPVAAAPISVKDPVSSTVPVLILQGAYDTATPVYSGRRAARELQNSTFVLVPQQGHEVWTSASRCTGQIATAFILDPAQKPDLSCLDVRRPQWALPAAGDTPDQKP